jgi:septal ring factor EnvC (AmiA/AmiB activator)
VTKQPEEERCRWCGRGFARAGGPGRPAQYCRRSCRQRDYEARRLAQELGLGETELVMARSELDELRDALYVLEAAIEDVDRDLQDAGDDPRELRRSIDWLLQAARPLLASRP